jgi:hypothetical protein
MRFSSVVFAVLAVGVALPISVLADQVSTQILNASNAPASIQRCQIDVPPYQYSSPSAWVNIENRTRHELLSVDIQYSFYDADKAMFGQATIQYTPSSPLASADVEQFSGTFWPNHSEPFTATSFVKCRIMAATFTGQHSWRYGQKWREPLVANESLSSETANAGKSEPVRLSVRVVSAWADPAPRFQTGYYIHDRVELQSAGQPVTVHPHDFILRIHNGPSAQALRGLSQPAPKYEKWNYALRQYEEHFEVNPTEDLGARGSLDVPGSGSATMVVTFYVASSSVDTSKMSDVSYLF